MNDFTYCKLISVILLTQIQMTRFFFVTFMSKNKMSRKRKQNNMPSYSAKRAKSRRRSKSTTRRRRKTAASGQPSFVKSLRDNEKKLSSEIKRIQDMELRLKRKPRDLESALRSDVSILSSMKSRQSRLKNLFEDIRGNLKDDIMTCREVLDQLIEDSKRKYKEGGPDKIKEAFEKAAAHTDDSSITRLKDAIVRLSPRYVIEKVENSTSADTIEFKVESQPLDVSSDFKVDALYDVASTLVTASPESLRRLKLHDIAKKAEATAKTYLEKQSKAEARDRGGGFAGREYDYKAAEKARMLGDRVLTAYSRSLRNYGSVLASKSNDVSDSIQEVMNLLSGNTRTNGQSIWEYLGTAVTGSSTPANTDKILTDAGNKLKNIRTDLRNQSRILKKMISSLSAKGNSLSSSMF